MTDKLDIATAGELFEIRVRGGLARLFNIREVTPTDEHMKMLRGEVEITARDLGRICHELHYVPEVQFHSRDDVEAEQE